MRTRYLVLLAGFLSLGWNGCKNKPADFLPEKTMEVCISDVPYRTESFLRIPYTLKLWEFEKEGLKLIRIVALDHLSQAELMVIDSTYPDPPTLYKSPLPVFPLLTWDEISHYYLSLQLPIPLTQTPPGRVIHRFEFMDTIRNQPVTYTGAQFSPRTGESVIAISSPVKGRNWLFFNQSTNGYHFNMLFFRFNRVYSMERFAFDNFQLNDELTAWFEGDPLQNTSYFNYLDTLFAVAPGRVVRLQDGQPENNGNAQNLTFQTLDEYAGNYLVLEIGDGLFAYYCHCVPQSFLVNPGDTVAEGAPLALLGNSGNSSSPHLHFHLADGPALWEANGVPFVLKYYVKTANMGFPPVFIDPTPYTNSMMEHLSVIRFE